MPINRCFLTGNLTRDPELRTTQGGTAILRFGLAVNDRVRGQDGQWTDRPNFLDCVVFGKRAESLADILAKGMKVAVEGRLHWSQWEAKDGTKRSRVEVWVDELELPQRARGERRHPRQQPAHSTPAPSEDVYDASIPF